MSKILCCIGIHSWSNYGKVIKGFTESVNESIENLKAEIK